MTRRKKLQLYLTEEEYAYVRAKAAQTRLSMSTYGKRILTGYEVKSLTDQETLLALFRLNADLGRVGGLLKKALSEGNLTRSLTVNKLLDELVKNKEEIMQKVRGLNHDS